MSAIREALEKTGIQIIGICKGVSEYVGKTRTYYSVDLECKGTKMPINVRLPEGFDRSKLPDYELVKLMCKIMPSYDKKAVEIHAI